MKALPSIISIILVLCLTSCRTTENVSERQETNSRASSLTAESFSRQSEDSGTVLRTEEGAVFSSSDSTVERFREYVVADSTGRILWHEMEHTRDRYTGNAQRRTSQDARHHGKKTALVTAQMTSRNDSIYNGGSLEEVTVVRKSWRLARFACLLGILSTVGMIIYRYTR